MFSKLLLKLNLITESEYQADLLDSLDDEEEISIIDGIFILMFFTVLFTTGIMWMNLL